MVLHQKLRLHSPNNPTLSAAVTQRHKFRCTPVQRLALFLYGDIVAVYFFGGLGDGGLLLAVKIRLVVASLLYHIHPL